MSNERRGSPRMPITLEAVINYQNLAYPCTIRNLSLSGAFIETSHLELPPNAPVEVGLTSYSNPHSRSQRLPATIKRIARNGAGIRFGDLQVEDYFTLVDLVYSS